VEFKAIIEMFLGSIVLCRHKGPTFRASHCDIVVDAAWQVITSWVPRNRVGCRTLSTASYVIGRRIDLRPMG
jgi:hypothetical protein